MNNESIKLLDNFANKLTNCHHREKFTTMLEHLAQGKFGFTYLTETENAELNEFVNAEDVSLVVNQIRNIIREPHIFLKRESIIQNASVANNIDTEALLETYTDYKLWKVKDDKVEPEYVHAFVNEDNLAIYENCFITYLIDLLLRHVASSVRRLMESVNTLNAMTGVDLKADSQASAKYFELFNDTDEVPVIINSNSAEVKTLNLFIKSQRILQSLTLTDFYKSCKKNKKFVISSLKPTNILMMDKRYNYCYLFYNRLVQNKSISKSPARTYRAFIALNFINALVNNGYRLENPNSMLNISTSGSLSIDNVEFVKEPFSITVNKQEDSRVISVEVKAADYSTAHYNIEVMEEEDFKTLEQFTDINDYAKYIEKNREEEINAEFLITNVAPVNVRNAAYVIPNKNDTAAKLQKFVVAMTLSVEASISVYSRKCPICGSNLVAPEEGDNICANCESKYHLYSYGQKEYAWIKQLPIMLDDANAIYNDEDTIDPKSLFDDLADDAKSSAIVVDTTGSDEPEATAKKDDGASADNVVYVFNSPKVEMPAVTKPEEKPLRLEKSFKAKILQLDENRKGYYNTIRNALLCRIGVVEDITWSFGNYFVGRNPVAKFAFKGDNLLLLLAIDPTTVRTQYGVKNLGVSKKFPEVPSVVVIKSERGVKLATDIINQILAALSVNPSYQPKKVKNMDLPDEVLVMKGLAKYV